MTAEDDDPLRIPDFLRREVNGVVPDRGPPVRRRASREKREKFGLPRVIEPAGLEILKEQRRARDDAKRARLRALREKKRAP